MGCQAREILRPKGRGLEISMIEVNTDQLSDQALEWAICEAEGLQPAIKDGIVYHADGISAFTSNWNEAGKLIDRYDIDLNSCKGRADHVKFRAVMDAKKRDSWGMNQRVSAHGQDYFTALGRVVVRSSFGHSVKIPNEIDLD